MQGMKKALRMQKPRACLGAKRGGKNGIRPKAWQFFFNGYLLTEGLLDHVYAHVLAQRFGHGDGAVIVLIVF